MNLWKEDKIIKPVLKQLLEKEDNPWILESQTKTSRTRSQNASIVTNMNIWQKNADQKRKNKKYKHISNATRKDT